MPSSIPYKGHGSQRRLRVLDSRLSPGNARQYQTMDSRQGGTTMGGKKLSEKAMDQVRSGGLNAQWRSDLERHCRTNDS